MKFLPDLPGRHCILSGGWPIALIFCFCALTTGTLGIEAIHYGDVDGRFPGLPPLTVLKPSGDGFYLVTLCEQLGQSYQDEIVHYRLENLKQPKPESWTLRDERGNAVPFQLEPVRGKVDAGHFWIWVERLDPGQSRQYRLEPKHSTPAVPFQIVSRSNLLECANGIVGMRAPVSIKFDGPIACEKAPGPIQGLLGIGGTWFGKAVLEGAGKVTAIESAVTVLGPVRVVVSVRYAFENPKHHYQLDLEMNARGNAIRLVEQGTFDDSAGRLAIGFDDWRPNHGIRPNTFSQQVLHDRFDGRAQSSVAVQNLRAFTGGGWYGLFREGGRDFLSIVPSLAGYWTPGDSVLVTCAENGSPKIESRLKADFHSFYLVLTDASQAIRCDTVPADAKIKHTEKPSEAVQRLTRRSPYGLMYFISSYQLQLLAGCCDPWYHRLLLNDMPLDKTKDWVLTHDDRDLKWPRLFGTKEDWPWIRQKTLPLLEEWQLRQKYLPIDYLASGKPQTFGSMDHVRDHWESSWRLDLTTQSVLNRGYAATPYVLTLGQAVHAGVRMTDTFKESLSAEQWTEWKKWALISGYILRDREYWWYDWQPGYATKYLPNFNTCQWASLGLLSILLPNHPQSKEWLAFARESLEKEFQHHIDADGVGQENPGSYFPFACSLIFPFIDAMQRHGIADYTVHPRFKAAVDYLFEVLTPPDPRAKNKRIIPRIGHHPGAGAIITDLCGWAAKLLRKSDPALSAYAQWAWKQQGGKLGFSHDFPLGLYLTDPDLPEKCPALKSRKMGSLGWIFRNHFPGNAETFFIIKSGPIASHFQDDEGAFSLYVHGVPLACDGLDLSSSDDRAINHNVVSFNGSGGGRGAVKAFVTTSLADYGQAELTGPRGYQRHVLLVKTPSTSELDYLVIYDRMTSDQPPQWNLDVHSEQPELLNGSASTVAPPLTGASFPGIRTNAYNVGLDCIFVQPQGATITFEKGAIDQNYVALLGVREHWYLRAPSTAGSNFRVVLVPFLQGGAHAGVRQLSDPRAIEVTYEGMKDIVLLSPDPFTFQHEGLEFNGRIAVARLGGPHRALALLDGTRLSYGKTKLNGPSPRVVNLR